MTTETKKHDGDRILEVLERGQHWVVQNKNKLITVFVVSIVLAFWYESHLSGIEVREEETWERAAGLNNLNEMELFIKTNSESNAGRFMILELIRKQLDAGVHDKALKYANQYIQKNPESKRLGLATLLRAYAHEELGDITKAKADYKKSAELSPVLATTASKALERLEN
jgi:tetratricopeptide (TPR) repeat protein